MRALSLRFRTGPCVRYQPRKPPAELSARDLAQPRIERAIHLAHSTGFPTEGTAVREVDSKPGPLKTEGSGTQIRPTRQCVCHPPQEKNGLPLQAAKGKPPESLSALREHHPAAI